MLKRFSTHGSSWFFNNAINVKLARNGEIDKFFHTEDHAALLKIDDINPFLFILYVVKNLFFFLLKI